MRRILRSAGTFERGYDGEEALRRNMRPGDTSQGGPRPDFPDTAWDVVHGAAAGSTHVRRASLEELCQRYWKPLYHYLRVARAK